MQIYPTKLRPGLGRWALLTVGLLAAGAAALAAEPLRPAATDRDVAKKICEYLEQGHLSRRKIDDEVARRLFKNFLKQLDPLKLYFERPDVDEFARQVPTLDDRLARFGAPANRQRGGAPQQGGDVQFAYDVFARFLQRFDERMRLIDEFVKADHDFALDETIAIDPDKLDWPATLEEARERWRKRIKYELLILKLDGLDPKAAQERVAKRYRNLAKREHQTDSEEVLEMYLDSLARSFDPHTSYLSPHTLEEFNISLRLSLEGIGAALRSEDGQTTLMEIVPGGAADQDGRLKPGDKIVGVAQGDGPTIDVVDMKLSDVVKLIRGPRGTDVTLVVVPAKSQEKKVYKLTRQKIELKGQQARGETIEDGRRPDGKPYRIGVIDLPSFYLDTAGAPPGGLAVKSAAQDVRGILERFNKDGVDAVVVDLRSDGGGVLSEAINVTGLFIDRGPVVQVKDFRGSVHQLDDTDRGAVYDGPLVVLVNRLSASASEIFAAAIQDYGRGLVLGDKKTHGKGTVQSVLDIGQEMEGPGEPPALGALKLTMQNFYRINGDSTQHRGVHSDVQLPALTDYMDIGEDHLDYALPFDQVRRARYSPLSRIRPDVVPLLQSLSDQRRRDSTEFRDLEADIKKFVDRKERKWVSLNEQKLRAEIKSSKDKDKAHDEEKAEEDEARRQFKGPNAPVFPRNFYNNEVLAVVEDYLRLSGKVVAGK